MPCERYRDALTEAAAGEPVAPALAAHLEGCAACRSELQALRRLMTAADDELSALATAEPSPALRARIRDAGAAPGPAFRWGFAWTATAAAVLALAALGAWRALGSPPSAVDSARTAVTAPSRPVAPATATLLSRSPLPERGQPPTPAAVADSPLSNTAGVARRGGRIERPSRKDEPAVLVPAGELEAFLRFASHLQARTVSADSLLVADLSDSLPEPRPLEIAPISIAALDLTDTSGRD
jgi:anti-sigma factor RsiW